jgi:hypothetical protein
MLWQEQREETASFGSLPIVHRPDFDAGTNHTTRQC